LVLGLLNADVETQKARRLNGGGRPAKYTELEEQLYTELEEQLHSWILERKCKGSSCSRSLNLFKELHPDMQAEEEFKASRGWLSNFKNRQHLVSRRHTSCQSLPEIADDICCQFIQEVHNIIEKKVFRSRTLFRN
jgi:Tc5 transposase DNA-binding domain